MIYSPDVKRAMLFAYNIHKNNYDKAGYPYIHHVLHVAEQMDTEEEVIVALLHDVLEDSKDVQIAKLFHQLNFKPEIEEAVHAITHLKEEPYMDYIERVSRNKIAKRVKIEDLKHNMQAERVNDNYSLESLMQRYTKAYRFLTEGH